MSEAPRTHSEAETYQRLRAHLAFLKLADAAQALPGLLDEARISKLPLIDTLERLLDVEVTATEDRRLTSRLRFACLPAPWRLADFDYSAQPGIDQALIRELATLRFIDEGANVMFIGPPGVGKTMLAVGLARAGAEAGHRVYFTTAADLAARCHKAAIEGRWATMMRFYAGPRLLAIDELGYLPLASRRRSSPVPSDQHPLHQRLLDVDHHQRRHRLLVHRVRRRPDGGRRHARPAPPSRRRRRDRRTLVSAAFPPGPRRGAAHRSRGETPCQPMSPSTPRPTARNQPASLPGLLDLVHPQLPEQPPPAALLLRRLPDRGLPTPPRTRRNPAPARRET